MTLKWIRMELARDEDFPLGSRTRGYEFVAPLDEAGRIDAEAWRVQRDRCRVKRFWEDQPDELGHLVRKRGGAWAFHYDLLGDEDDDETGYRLGDHRFKSGEYLSVREHDDVLRTFRVTVVRDLD